MELKPADEVLPEELPYVEAPSWAAARLQNCGLREFPLPPRRYWIGQGLRGLTPELQRLHALRHVRSGRLLLVTEPHRPPQSPIVRWQLPAPTEGGAPDALAGRWVFDDEVVWSLPSLLRRQLAELNRSGRGPEHVLCEAYGYPDRYTRRPLAAFCSGAQDGAAPEPTWPAWPVVETPHAARRQLQVGVFFDGTGHHKDVDRQLTDRDVTNIGKLHDLYRDEPGDYVRRIYVPGPGAIGAVEQTPNGRTEAEASVVGLAFATGPEGGQARIRLAKTYLRRVLNAHPDVDRITFDVFGFSRGAALARHFVNLIHDGLPGVRIPASVALEVRFLGLFDTVGSFYWPGNDDEGTFNLHLHGGSAQRVVHYTARHEIRVNYPLSSLKDANGRLPGNFSEIELPGAHGDVGGGYENPDKDFANVEQLPVRLRANLALAGDAAIRRAQEEAAKRGRYIRVQYPDVVEVEHRYTRKELSRVALRKMHEQALAAGVPLRPLPQDNPDYVLPPALEQAWQRWQAAGGSMAEARHFLGEYIHTSHRQPLGSAGPMQDLRNYADRPEPSGVRRVFHNTPPWAVGSGTQVMHALA